MNKSLILALAAAGTMLGAGAAHAGNVQWSVGINLPVPGIVLPLPPLPRLVVTGGPVYQQPSYGYRAEPVYAPAPVYYQPEPVYYAPEPVYYPNRPQWRHHYRPAPVVVEVPRYQPGWQAVTYPRYRDERREDRREWRHEERRDDRHERHDRRD
jgi:hypothetical protein